MNSFNQNEDDILAGLHAIDPAANRASNPDAMLAAGLEKASSGKGSVHGWRIRGWQFGMPTLAGLSGLGVAAIAGVVAVTIFVSGPGSTGHYLFRTAGSGGSGAASAKSVTGAAASMALVAGGPAGDYRMGIMMPAFDLHYVAGDSLSTAGGSAHIFQLQPIGDPQEIANRLSEYFNIKGGTTRVGDNGKWYEYIPSVDASPNASSGDGSGATSGTSDVPSVTYLNYDKHYGVSLNPQSVGLFFNDNAGYNWTTCQQFQPTPAECAGVTKQDLPSLAQATKTAGKLLSSLGVQLSDSAAHAKTGDYVLSAATYYPAYGVVGAVAYDAVGQSTDQAAQNVGEHATENGVMVTASLVVGGQLTPVQIQIQWQPGYSDIASINGEIATAIDRGSFDTLSPKSTVERLNQNYYSGQSNLDWQSIKWSQYTYSGMTPELRGKLMACANPQGLSVARSTTIDVNPGAPQPTEVQPTELQPTYTANADVIPTPTPCEFPQDKNGMAQLETTVTKSEVTQLEIWDSNGGAWLVPGYHFYDSSGYLASVYSVVDGVIQMDIPADK